MEIKNLTKALVDAQSKFPKLKKDDQNFHNQKFASLNSILASVVPVLNKAGLAVMQFPINDVDRIGVKTIIVHGESGESISESFTVNLGDKKHDPQGAGAAISYARRYSILAVLGLNAEDDDASSVSHQGEDEPVINIDVERANDIVRKPGPKRRR